MSASPQTYKNHVKFVPMFHYVLLPLLLVNFLAMTYQAWQQPNRSTGWAVAMSFAFIVMALFARVFALRAQDRVIRLEERLRMREVLPQDLQARINDFSPEQLIGLRFASDAELPSLAAAVLRDNIQKRDAIKKMVKNWRADTLRV
ncbi:MAG: hypothetical protein A3F70_01600 [Acidobacteria bacterium RIFCSPLOWO2_12_FULL_67_14]|nr:MAG: hypothetical protein A3H29_01290 [Acidobacteria bacterium RIFCSPLOWO2_02_FULL_67_21]OFW40542.1 MAG: hypothetical protein A3F70_01600 [Acidobacteria bacterium RIFCSPLOWO2_12_FULL_67_14]